MPNAYEELSQFEIGRSLDFLTSPSSYVELDRTKDGRLYRFCIDSRPQKTDRRIKTAIQTAGGQVGYGQDEALVQMAAIGEIVPSEVGILDEIGKCEGCTVGGAHYGCLYVAKLAEVTEEEANPSDQTKYNLGRYLEHLALPGEISPLIGELSVAAAFQHEYIVKRGTKGLVKFVDTADPKSMVDQMVGQSRAVVWINNYAQRVSLDRQTKHRVQGIQGQAYHNSLGAAVLELETVAGSNKHYLGYRIGALLLRSAATQTIVLDANPHLKKFDVITDTTGALSVTEAAT